MDSLSQLPCIIQAPPWYKDRHKEKEQVEPQLDRHSYWKQCQQASHMESESWDDYCKRIPVYFATYLCTVSWFLTESCTEILWWWLTGDCKVCIMSTHPYFTAFPRSPLSLCPCCNERKNHIRLPSTHRCPLSFSAFISRLFSPFNKKVIRILQTIPNVGIREKRLSGWAILFPGDCYFNWTKPVPAGLRSLAASQNTPFPSHILCLISSNIRWVTHAGQAWCSICFY